MNQPEKKRKKKCGERPEKGEKRKNPNRMTENYWHEVNPKNTKHLEETVEVGKNIGVGRRRYDDIYYPVMVDIKEKCCMYIEKKPDGEKYERNDSFEILCSHCCPCEWKDKETRQKKIQIGKVNIGRTLDQGDTVDKETDKATNQWVIGKIQDDDLLYFPSQNKKQNSTDDYQILCRKMDKGDKKTKVNP